MEEEHTTWLRRNYAHLARKLPVMAILEDLVRNYVFAIGSDEYKRITSPELVDRGDKCRALLQELSGKSANAFLYFIRAVNRICPEILIGCEPAEDTQRYVVAVMSDSDRVALCLALHWNGMIQQQEQHKTNQPTPTQPTPTQPTAALIEDCA